MTTSNSNKILVFFVLTFLCSFLIEEIQQLYKIFEHLKFALLIPGIIALFMLFYYEVPGTFESFIKRRIIPTVKFNLIPIIVSLLPLIIIPVSFLIYKLLYNQGAKTSEIEFSFIVWPVIGIFFEEIGWRGYFQHKAGSFINMIIATLLTGALWFLVQYDLYFNDPFLGIVLLILYLSFSVILSYLFFLSNRNIILCYVFRLTHTILSVIFIAQYSKEMDFIFIITLIYLIAAIVVLVFNKRLFQIDTEDKL